jgi:hypothetical protein
MNYEIHEGGDGSVYVKDLSMVRTIFQLSLSSYHMRFPYSSVHSLGASNNNRRGYGYGQPRIEGTGDSRNEA